jgi:hypothetical protein
MKTFADKILKFYRNLQPDFKLPDGVEIMNPYQDDYAYGLTSAFYGKFFNDANDRTYIFGINPGRFGGGVTGIPFTDPVRLKTNCGIEHQLPLKPELSSGFVYNFIDAFGGPEAFYNRFLLTAICPLGFTLDGKNLNYYDSKELYQLAKPFVISTLKEQLLAGCRQQTAFCLGEGINFRYFEALNSELKLFDKIVSLPHPRWIMQYRRKKMDEYIKQYVEVLNGN